MSDKQFRDYLYYLLQYNSIEELTVDDVINLSLCLVVLRKVILSNK